MNLSEKLRELRKREGLSQEQLAEKIGVSRQAVTKWETGRGLPDIENMVILGEVFKLTVDELISESEAPESVEGFVTETVYDVDRDKHFDIHVGSARTLSLRSGEEEKIRVRMYSESIEEIGSIFKVTLDEHKNRLDVDCVLKDSLSRYEAEDDLDITIIFPERYSEECEINASVKVLSISDLHFDHLEYDGDATETFIENSSGRMDFTGKTDYEFTVDRVEGILEIRQWFAKSVLHIREDRCPRVEKEGRFTRLYFMRDGEQTEFQRPESEDKILITGTKSELVVDLL